MSRNDDQQLDDALRGLPRIEPSSHFTTRVLAHAREHARRPSWRGWTRHRLTAQLMASAAIAAVAALSVNTWRHTKLPVSVATAARPAVAEDERRALRSEYEALRSELAALERLRAVSNPVLYLGSTDQVDLVLDLGRYVRERQRGTTTTPAHFRAPTRQPPIRHTDDTTSGGLYP